MKFLRSSVNRWYIPVVLVLMVVLPWFVSNIYYLHLINLSLITIILALGLNLLTGYAGQISIGHAAFYAIGAYSSAILTTRLGISFWLSLPLAGLIAALFGYVIGRPTLRLKGAYLAVGSIGIGEITQLVLTNWTGFTGGALGIKGIHPPVLFGYKLDSDMSYYYMLAVMIIIVYLLVSRIIDSELGRAFKSIREDEVAAQFMGVDVARLKVLAFIISTFLAGIAGSLYAHLEGYISPAGFGFTQSVAFLIMILAGGLGFKIGPIIGVLILTFAREGLRFFNNYQLVVYGLLLILIIIFMPKGIAGYVSGLSDRLRGRRG